MPKIENIIDTVENCRYCLMCRHVDPLEMVTKRESLSPHGLALLVASVRRGMTDYTPEVIEKLYSHPDAGVSRAHCITDQPHSEAFAAVRAEIAAAGNAPKIAYTIKQTLEKWGTPHTYQPPQPAEGEGDVALFVGDETAYLWPPDELEAALTLLEAAGVQPVLIGRGRNSGLLAQQFGFPELAEELVNANLQELVSTGASTMLVLSPGDAYAFGKGFEERLGIQFPDSVKIVEVVNLLANGLAAGDIAFNEADDVTPWTYIDPAHAVRVPDRHDVPRALLSAVLPTTIRELFWRRERAHPAGSTYIHFANQDVAEKLTFARLQDAKDAGAELVITEDAGTLFQLNVHAEKFGLRERGLFSLLAEHLQAEK